VGEKKTARLKSPSRRILLLKCASDSIEWSSTGGTTASGGAIYVVGRYQGAWRLWVVVGRVKGGGCTPGEHVRPQQQQGAHSKFFDEKLAARPPPSNQNVLGRCVLYSRMALPVTQYW